MQFATLLTTTTSTTWLDPALIAIIAGSTVLGLMRGLIRSVAGFVGLILAAVLAGRLAVYVQPSLDHANIQHPPVNGAVAFIIAFVAVYVAVEIGAKALKIVTTMFLLGWVDRLGGAVFGLLRGLLISMFLIAGLTMLGSQQFNSTVKQAQTAVFLWQNFSGIADLLPQGMQNSVIRLVNNQRPFTQQPAP